MRARPEHDHGELERARARFLGSIASGTRAGFADAAAVAQEFGLGASDLAPALNAGGNARRRALGSYLGVEGWALAVPKATARRFCAYLRGRDPELARVLFGDAEDEEP